MDLLQIRDWLRDLPCKEGAIIADQGGEAKKDVAKEEPEDEETRNKPSFTLHVKNLPADLDKSELEMRLVRHGEVAKQHQLYSLEVCPCW